jgi:hypothetical protein
MSIGDEIYQDLESMRSILPNSGPCFISSALALEEWIVITTTLKNLTAAYDTFQTTIKYHDMRPSNTMICELKRFISILLSTNSSRRSIDSPRRRRPAQTESVKSSDVNGLDMGRIHLTCRWMWIDVHIT